MALHIKFESNGNSLKYFAHNNYQLFLVITTFNPFNTRQIFCLATQVEIKLSIKLNTFYPFIFVFMSAADFSTDWTVFC